MRQLTSGNIILKQRMKCSVVVKPIFSGLLKNFSKVARLAACNRERICFILISLSRSEDLMVPTLSKKGAASFVQSASTDPFTIEWYMKMTDNADVNKDLESHFTLKDPRFHETPTLIDFAVVFETFYKEHRV